ncbi:Protein OS-9, partial [Quaeritorhiza haematococci]
MPSSPRSHRSLLAVLLLATAAYVPAVRAMSNSFVYSDFYAHPQHQVLFGKNPLQPAQLEQIDMSDPSYVVMPLSTTGETYLCRLPAKKEAHPQENTGLQSTSGEAQQKDLRRAIALLEPMRKSCLYHISGWWTYEFCYKKHIRQFHPLTEQEMAQIPANSIMQQQEKMNFFLGKHMDITPPPKYSSSSSSKSSKNDGGGAGAAAASTKDVSAPAAGSGGSGKDVVVKYGGTELVEIEDGHDDSHVRRYLRQKWGGGSWCDVTGQPRTTEVQYHCSPSHEEHIALIKETSTCNYKVVIHTPHLCRDPAFVPRNQDEAQKIVCSPLPPSAPLQWDSGTTGAGVKLLEESVWKEEGVK